MTDAKPTLPPRPQNGTSTAVPPSPSAARNRLPSRTFNRAQTDGSSDLPTPELARRRSSLLSFSSLDDARQTFQEDIINGGSGRKRKIHEEEVSHWHSTPLAFAILPAIGGLLFKNGSAFVTDVLLLALAAVFLNWSVRLPWDWYYSAQSLVKQDEPDLDTILEEDDAEQALQDSTELEVSPKAWAEGFASKGTKSWALDSTGARTPTEASVKSTTSPSPNLKPQSATLPSLESDAASADLRVQEKLALLATFAFPAIAAYLLHLIRSQLSRSSQGLISDFNLSIFLLAAEIRPCMQLIRLVTDRTLHLQRIATGLDDPRAAAKEQKGLLDDLKARLADLEVRLSEHQVIPQTVTIAQKADVTDLSAQLKKRYEPRLEGLERAVRRYEKRSTTMAMLTDQRLRDLERRIDETLTLATVAAQSSQRPGIVSTGLSWTSTAITWPMKLVWAFVIWPFAFAESMYSLVIAALLGPRAKNAQRSRSRPGFGRDEKGRERGMTRKVLR